MRTPLLVLFVICSLCSFAQDVSVTVDVRYRDKNDQEVKSDSAWYYQTVDSIFNDIWKRSAIYANGNPRYIEDVGKLGDPGRHIYFYATGEVMARGTIKNNLFIGPFSFFHRDGIRLAGISYPEAPPKYGEEIKFRILEYRDSTGNKLVDAGNGVGVLTFPCELGPFEGAVVKGSRYGPWKGMDNGYPYEDLYKDGVLVEGSYSKKGETFRYRTINKAAIPPGGIEKYYKYIFKRLKYPQELRNIGLEGNLYVQFDVNKDGTLSNIKNGEGSTPACGCRSRESSRGKPSVDAGPISRRRCKTANGVADNL